MSRNTEFQAAKVGKRRQFFSYVEELVFLSFCYQLMADRGQWAEQLLVCPSLVAHHLQSIKRGSTGSGGEILKLPLWKTSGMAEWRETS